MQSSPMDTVFFAPFMPQGGETPLHVAAASDNLNADVVKFLVAAGANLDLKNKVR
jgi:ankyrin repeat protein